MLDWLRFEYQLFKLQRNQRQTHRYYRKVWNKAKGEKKSEEDLHDLASEENLNSASLRTILLSYDQRILYQKPKNILYRCRSSTLSAENGKDPT